MGPPERGFDAVGNTVPAAGPTSGDRDTTGRYLDATGPPGERATDRLREMIRDIRSHEVISLAEQIARTTTDPYEVARAYLMKLGALINLGRTADCPAVVDKAQAALRRCPDPALLGEFHALAAWVAYTEGSLDRAATNLVTGSRMLERATSADIPTADAWCDLAITYSYLGFHERATYSLERGIAIAQQAGLSIIEYACPQITVRSALWYDHCGDTDRCRDQLVSLLEELQSLLANLGGLSALRPDDLPYVDYAVARLAALGHADAALPVPAQRAPRVMTLPEAATLRELSRVCRAISERKTDEALHRLSRLTVEPRTVGAAEPHRLRALAYAAAGDFVAADAADRAAFQAASADIERIRALFVDGIAARLDHEDLRRTVGRYAGEALTDPLTGLANRRSLERRFEKLTRDKESGVLGVIDLDSFKAVNTVHGHLTGDLVLQRVAGALVRTLRRRDFLARYGGDEFVVILPSTTLAEAQQIGERLVNAVRGEDWESLVPGTPVSASVGWAEIGEDTGLIEAFAKADRAMLDAKQRARP